MFRGRGRSAFLITTILCFNAELLHRKGGNKKFLTSKIEIFKPTEDDTNALELLIENDLVAVGPGERLSDLHHTTAPTSRAMNSVATVVKRNQQLIQDMPAIYALLKNAHAVGKLGVKPVC